MDQASAEISHAAPRLARSEDARVLARFNIDMALETESYDLDQDTILAGVTSLIAHPERGFYLVIDRPSTEPGAASELTDTSQIVASLMITTEWSDWRNGAFWWIQSVYVTPAWRRRGLYSQLYAEVKRRAAETGSVCGYRLYVEKNNATAQQTYRALGMDETHYLMFEEAASPIRYHS